MKRLIALIVTTLVVAVGIIGCSSFPGANDPGWVTVFDGKNLDNFNRVGNANWRLEDGLAVADGGNGHLVSKNAYGNFRMRAEFWANPEVNSGIFLRAQDPKKIASTTSYEVNILDAREKFGTGSVVNFKDVERPFKAGGKWNVFEITANGPRLTVVLNGETTVDFEDSKFANGPFSLQYNGAERGVIKWRKIQVRPL